MTSYKDAPSSTQQQLGVMIITSPWGHRAYRWSRVAAGTVRQTKGVSTNDTTILQRVCCNK